MKNRELVTDLSVLSRTSNLLQLTFTSQLTTLTGMLLTLKSNRVSKRDAIYYQMDSVHICIYTSAKGIHMLVCVLFFVKDLFGLLLWQKALKALCVFK
jgi:hypothetical protein